MPILIDPRGRTPHPAKQFPVEHAALVLLGGVLRERGETGLWVYWMTDSDLWVYPPHAKQPKWLVSSLQNFTDQFDDGMETVAYVAKLIPGAQP